MAEVPSRELRNHTRALLDRVERGEEVVITVHGRPTAVLSAVAHRPTWMSAGELVRRITAAQADPELAGELRALAPETTADLPRW